MTATPNYGIMNGVEELNLGQLGSARATANTARYTVRFTLSGERSRKVRHDLPQQAVSFEDQLGANVRTFTWSGTLKTNTLVTLNKIRDELTKAIDGYTRVNGDPTSFDVTQIQQTRLTDGDGNIVTESARMTGFRFGDRVSKITGDVNFNYLTELTVTFETL